MVDAIIDNIYLINAPAGSGKTTRIKSMLIDHTAQHPEDNILCITYTNRAADELKEGIENNKIFFGTIHSFINNFISPFFCHKDVLDLFWENYEEIIINRIENLDDNPDIFKSNQRYIDKYGHLNIDVLKKNIDKISYNEANFNSLYYGGLSHDDLITFTKKIVDKYPVIKTKINKKYQVIFLDEYQDTNSEVLQLLFSTVKDSQVKMYILGDKMQQIYENYDGMFENEFGLLNTEISLDVNHRSIPHIIKILNNIYNDPEMHQKINEKNKEIKSDHEPIILLCKSFDEIVEEKSIKYPNTLILYLFNRNKYKKIGAENLYNSFDKMKRYSFVSKYKVADILSDTSSENPDSLMKFLFMLDKIYYFYNNEQYGNIISLCKKNKKYFNVNTCLIKKHKDKKRLKDIWNEIFTVYDDEEAKIRDVLEKLSDNNIINKHFIESIYNLGEYEAVLEVLSKELKLLGEYLNNMNISTQHGVKGESHDTVIFVAENSRSTPIVHMYEFFEVWSKLEFSLKEFEDFYYSYIEFIKSVEEGLGMRVKELDSNSHNNNEDNKQFLKNKTEEILAKFSNDDLFNNICKDSYDKYLNKPNLGNVKKCFNVNKVAGVLIAYKLFYVGCSRARRNLTILVDKSKISSFENEFIVKAEETGFLIENV